MASPEPEPLAEIGRRLRHACARKRWTIETLARQAGLGRTTVSHAVNGRKLPSEKTLVMLAQRLGEDPRPLLILRNAAQVEVKHEPDSGPVIIDIGAIIEPNTSMAFGSTRFSISNCTDKAIKVTGITLEIIDRRYSSTTQQLHPGAPLTEYELTATIDESSTSVDLLTQHHILKPGETDGFYLKIFSEEGWVYDLALKSFWHEIGTQAKNIVSSEGFAMEFAPRSPRAMIALILRIRANQGGIQ